MIGQSFVEKSPDLCHGGVLCLVGPSGTGKTEIASALTKDERFVKPVTTTTRPKAENESDGAYRFVGKEQFLREKENGEFIETTVYGTYYYGTSGEQITPIVEAGRIAVIPIDICGAISLKNLYRSRCALAFTDSDKRAILTNIIHRNIPEDDKINRIMSIDFELRNIEFCDFALRYDEGLESCVDTVYRELNVQKG